VDTGNDDYELNISSTYQTDDSPKKFEQMAKYGKRTDGIQNGVTICEDPTVKLYFSKVFSAKMCTTAKGMIGGP
jgi:hypothetical protein